MKNKLHILKSELPEDGQQLSPKDVGGLINKSFVQQVSVKFYICLTEVYVIKDNINAFNKTLNKPIKAVPPCWTRIMRFCPYAMYFTEENPLPWQWKKIGITETDM